MMTLNLLWSMNDRMAGGPGLELPAPDWRWIDDLIEISEIDAEKPEEATTDWEELMNA